MTHKRTVLITGGSAGIGLAVVESLLAANYRVINLARRRVPFSDENIVDHESICLIENT